MKSDRTTVRTKKIPYVFKNRSLRLLGLALFVNSLVTPLRLFFPTANIQSDFLFIGLALILFVISVTVNSWLYDRYGDSVYLWRWYVTSPFALIAFILTLVVRRHQTYDYGSVIIPVLAALWVLAGNLFTIIGWIDRMLTFYTRKKPSLTNRPIKKKIDPPKFLRHEKHRSR